jgi:hypothetical protein
LPAQTKDIAMTTNLLSTLTRSHPRLLATAADFNRMRQTLASDDQLAIWWPTIKSAADKMLTEPPSQYEIPDGKRLLATSRRVVDRAFHLALAHRLTNDPRYRDRLWEELKTAAAFKDWNPSHFLDAAEMTYAFAIGYDWLYAEWSPEQRTVIREAIIQHGLEPAQRAYRGQASCGWWTKAEHNWNQVCNGGMGVGALAIADESPLLAGEILSHAVRLLPHAMKHFAPDGGWSEGPGYWHYAVRYNVAFIAALETALGTDRGLTKLPGFDQAGTFPLHVTGPTDRTFNYADSGDGLIRAPEMFWLARRFSRPEFAGYQYARARPAPLDLLWHSPGRPAAPALPLDRYFRGIEVATFRGAWSDPRTWFVGFKAGDNKANHSNLDLGSFVLDSLGQRWAVDLGKDDYNLPGYFGAERWTYYRLRAEGHNTLVINPGKEPDQDPKAAAPITRFGSTPDHAFAIADLTAAYAKQAANVERGIALVGRNRLLVQDEVTALPGKTMSVWWFLHTAAEVKLDDAGSVATLTLGGETLRAKILLPTTATFTIMEAAPLPSSPHPPRQAANIGIRKLAVHLPGTSDARLIVVLSAGEPGQVSIRPLKDWR